MTSVYGRQLFADRLKDCGPLWRRSAFRSLMERLAQFRFARIASRAAALSGGWLEQEFAGPATVRGKIADPEGAAAEKG
jgi:hypothetical protein